MLATYPCMYPLHMIGQTALSDKACLTSLTPERLLSPMPQLMLLQCTQLLEGLK